MNTWRLTWEGSDDNDEWKWSEIVAGTLQQVTDYVNNPKHKYNRLLKITREHSLTILTEAQK